MCIRDRGYAQDRTLFYVKGGLALGSIGLSTQAASSETIYNSGYSTGSSTTDTVWAGHKNQIRAGYALGGGIEQALSDSVSLRVDGTYFDLGTTTATATGTTITTGTGSPPVPAGNGTAQSYSVSKKADGLLLSVGLNFRY